MSSVGSFINSIETKYRDFGVLETNGESFPVTQLKGISNFGPQIQAVLEEYKIDDVTGINHWFEEMTKDFLSPQGLPLPFAEALQKVTGMPPGLAIEWLSANITDAAELSAEAAVVAFFRKNPKIYSACLVLGIAFGFHSDNSLLISANGLQYFAKLRAEGRLQNSLWTNADRFLRTSFVLVDRVCTITFIAEAGFKMAGISLSQLSGDMAESIGLGGKLAAAAHLPVETLNVVDLVDGVANLGLSMLVGKAVGKMVEWLNENPKQELEEVSSQIEAKLRLRELLKQEAPPETLIPLIEIMKEQGSYRSILDQRK